VIGAAPTSPAGEPRSGCALCRDLGEDCGRHEPDDGLAALLEEEQAIRERVRVDPNALDDDLERCAPDIAYLGARHARATLAYGRARIGAKKIRALAYVRAKQAALAEYGSSRGGATADLVEAMTDQDPDYLAAAELEIQAEAVLALAKSNLDAARARKDMLVQCAATRRAEMERDAYVVRRQSMDTGGAAG
jgi:hypothetical protein